MKKTKIQKMLTLALAVTMVAGSTLTVGATTNNAASACTQAATSEAAAVVSAVATIPSTSAVTVNGQKITTTVKGAYLAESVKGFAVMTPVSELSAAYGLSAAQTPYILVQDTDVEKSYNAMNSLNAAAQALGAQVGLVLNIDLGYRENGKYAALPVDGADVLMTVALPDNFADANATYAVVVVRMGGAVKVLADLDGNADTVTFNTAGGLGCYAVIKY